MGKGPPPWDRKTIWAARLPLFSSVINTSLSKMAPVEPVSQQSKNNALPEIERQLLVQFTPIGSQSFRKAELQQSHSAHPCAAGHQERPND
jgi:hypothetical protein